MNSVTIGFAIIVCFSASLSFGCEDIHPSCEVLAPRICNAMSGEQMLCQKTCGHCSFSSECEDSVPKVFCSAYVESDACEDLRASQLCKRSCGLC